MADKKVVKAVKANEQEIKKPITEKGNVLVLGNSGVGKSTLINAVIGDDVAKTSYGTEGTTKELAIYESDDCPFRPLLAWEDFTGCGAAKPTWPQLLSPHM